MKIIYFITPANINNLETWLHHYLQDKYSSSIHYHLQKRHNPDFNKDYLRLTLPSQLSEDELYLSFREAAQQLHFDFFIKPAQPAEKGIIAFDMDSTFVQEEGVDEIARAVGLSAEIAELTREAMAGRIDFNASFARRIMMLKGTHIDVLNQVSNSMTLSPGLDRLLPWLKQQGFITVIISGGLNLFTEHLKNKYALDYVFSNKVIVEDGKLTGDISLPIMNADEKRRTLASLAEKLHISNHNIIACGDGANDIPMLTLAGTGVAWHAKPIVRDNIRHQINVNDFEALFLLIDKEA